MTANVRYVGSAALARRLGEVSRSVFDFREESAFVYRVLLVFGFAAFTGVSAQVSLPLPFTPVPVTGQVFAVLVAGAALGRWLGPASQATYVGLGALGVPWFAPSAGQGWFTSGGVPAVLGVTGGYLLGFLVAAAVIGWVIDRGFRRRSYGLNLMVLLLGVVIVYAIGAAQFALILRTNLTTTLLYAVVPFLPGDILKALLAATVLLVVVPSASRTADSRATFEPSPPGRPDFAAVALVMAGTWGLALLIATASWVPADLTVYYVVSAVACTGAALSALAIRYRLAARLAPGLRDLRPVT